MNRELRIYRLVDDQRVPVTLILDKTFLVIDEVFEDKILTRVVYGSSTATFAKMTAWIKEDSENNIEGTDELRAQFFADLKHLTDTYKGNCPPCKKGSLVAKYRKQLEANGLI